MRHLLLILMIALLPLRGWVSDAMATGMAAGQVEQLQQRQVAIKSIAIHAHEVNGKAHLEHEMAVVDVAQTPADCAGHEQESKADAGASHCDSCSACQACHTVALSSFSSLQFTAFHAFAAPHAASAQFASADAALRQKPPIS